MHFRQQSTVPCGSQLFGVGETHVVQMDPGWSLGPVLLHASTIAAFGALRSDALCEGFDLRVVSGFRSFQRQLAIWNAKALGQRPVFDEHEQPLDIGSLCNRERIFAILRWTALPGTSRHHWGSDIDVIDAASMPADYKVRLSVQETRAGGLFAALHSWLDERIARDLAHGFFRPYTGAGCAVAAEPWHLSFAPLAWQCQTAFDADALARLQYEEGMELQSEVARCREEILRRFFEVPLQMYPSRWLP